jgi:hypothetical protein
MKRSVTLTMVLVFVSLGLIATFAVSEGAIPRIPRPKPPEPPPVGSENLYEEPTSPETPGIAGPRIGPDPLADPNKVRARVKSFEGLEKALMDVDRQSQNEMREWLQKTTDNRVTLERAVERQVRAELDFIRKLAVEEKAVKTVAAIDGIALNRQERSRKLLRRMEEEAKALRQPRSTRGRTRDLTQENVGVAGQGFGQDVNQPRLRLRRR